MKAALVSDIHGNLESLRAALELIASEDEILCLGDTVGYGPDPNGCVELVRRRATKAVLGNHDVAAINGFGLEYFNPAAQDAMRWTQGVLAAENRAWLDTLAYEVRAPEYLMVHGAPVRYFEYILDKEGAARAFAATDARLIFVGHTHIAEYYALDEKGAIAHGHMQQGGELQLKAGARYIINPGSVGQPRDLNPRAAFAFYEPDEHKVTYRRYDYAIAEVQQKIRAAELPGVLSDRLSVGR